MNRRTASRADTRLIPKSALFALIGLILSPLAVAHAATSPSDRVRSCGLFDYEQWQRDHPRPAAKQLADLNVSEPRTVRMLYVLPNDRPYRAAVVDSMKTMIRRVQTFYAEQMQAHGYGNRTFRFETDAQGEPLVHRVDGRHPDQHYLNNDSMAAVRDDLQIDAVLQFNYYANVYLTVVDNSEDAVISDGSYVGGVAWDSGKSGGIAVVPSSLPLDTVAHELGHTFGLPHDFRDDTYIMSYGYDSDRLSACAAEFLSVHPYFNPNSPVEPGLSPTIELISPSTYPLGSASVPIRLKVGASKGLHQAILLGIIREPHYAAGLVGVQECRGFAGQKEAVARFEYDGTVPSSPLSSLSDLVAHSLWADVVDADGNLASKSVALVERSPYMVATLRYNKRNTNMVTTSSPSFSPDGSLLALAKEKFEPKGRVHSTFIDAEILLWDVASRQQIATLQQEERASSLSFSPDGSLLAVGAWDKVLLWDVASRQQIATLQQEGWASSLSFSPDGTLLATAKRGERDKVLLWDVASRQQVATLDAGQYDLMFSSIPFSPDGSLLAAGAPDGWDGVILLWDVASRQQIATLQQEDWASSLSFSPDGTLLATSEQDKVLLWDVASRQQIATLQQEDRVHSLSFSPDGSLLAAAGSWHEIVLWDVASRQQITTLYEPLVSSISFSPDGSLLAAESVSDRAVWLWDMAKVAVAQTAHSLTKVSGDGQQGPANTQLAKPFVVSVLDQDGSPIAGVRVAFSNFFTSGGALLSPTSHADPCAVGFFASSIDSYTNANGQASIRLTLGSLAVHSVKATVEGLEPVTFAATKSGQANPHRLTKVCGDSQEGIVDEQLAEPFVVSVSDENGAAIAGVAVSFAVTAGEGTLSSATDTTDANGRAATSLTLGSEAGTNTVAATVEGLRSATFTATGERSGLASMFDAFGSGKPTALPDHTQLLQNAPNPFNSQTVLSYFLLEPSLTRLEVFALTGQRVAVLHQGPQQAGYHRLHWDGRDAAGFPVASGVYLYRLVTDETLLTRKLILLR